MTMMRRETNAAHSHSHPGLRSAEPRGGPAVCWAWRGCKFLFPALGCEVARPDFCRSNWTGRRHCRAGRSDKGQRVIMGVPTQNRSTQDTRTQHACTHMHRLRARRLPRLEELQTASSHLGSSTLIAQPLPTQRRRRGARQQSWRRPARRAAFPGSWIEFAAGHYREACAVGGAFQHRDMAWCLHCGLIDAHTRHADGAARRQGG